MKRLLTIFKDSHQSFHGQETGEKVVLLLRKHRFVIFLPLSFLIIAFIAPFLAASLLSAQLSPPEIFKAFLFVSTLWYMGFWLVTFYFLTIYNLNTIIITNRRIIDNDQKGFFDRKVSELHVHRIQDVAVHTSGIIETVLGFGDIVVQTAASEKQFVFRQIADPEYVKDTIMQIVATQFTGVEPL